MKVIIIYTIRGPAGTIRAPTTDGPVECEDLASLLVEIAKNLPGNADLGVETVGIEVRPYDVEDEKWT